MRKSLLFVTLLASLLLSTAVVSAQSMSVIGGIGMSSVSADIESADPNRDYDSGRALQAGAVYGLTDNIGIGVLYDWTTGSISVGTEKETATLSGFNAIAQFEALGSSIGFGAFGGIGMYSLTTKWTAPGYYPLIVTGKTALGFIFGADVKYPLGSNLHLTGGAAYRSASFTTVTINNGVSRVTGELDMSANALSFSGGISVGF